jgi:hypothetical protein
MKYEKPASTRNSNTPVWTWNASTADIGQLPTGKADVVQDILVWTVSF